MNSTKNQLYSSVFMKKRISASNIMRVVSILGIICLLALQWVWWRNAYRAVEMDFMKNSQECLTQAFDKALTFAMEDKSKKFKVIRDNRSSGNPKKIKIVSNHSVQNTSEISYLIEEMLFNEKKPITKKLIDIKYNECLKEEYGTIPKYDLQIYRLSDVIDSVNKPKYNRIAIGNGHDTIYHQFGFMAFTTVIIPSPVGYYIKKGAFIFSISIILVLLIGSILILQFINMQRDRKFADFIIDYTRMMTHDLRTPVTGIHMIFKMFQKNQFSDETLKEKYIAEGMALSNKVLLNLDNILYMAKSEQRELPVHLFETDFKVFMEKIVRSYRQRDYNPKIVTINTIYEPSEFKCRMDLGLMENVMCNLIENAIKFTPQEALISIQCFREGNQVVIKIKDNGQGMSVEDQKRIFGLFERGTANKNNAFPGFGIGLHFVERVVKAHGGKVTVQSELGKGTEFTIRYTS